MTKATDGSDDSDIGAEREWNVVNQSQYERDGDHDLTTVIIAAVAEFEGVSPTEISEPVLYDCVDVAALEDAFFGPDGEGSTRDSVGTAEFRYGEYRVVVRSDGWISIYERDGR